MTHAVHAGVTGLRFAPRLLDLMPAGLMAGLQGINVNPSLIWFAPMGLNFQLRLLFLAVEVGQEGRGGVGGGGTNTPPPPPPPPPPPLSHASRFVLHHRTQAARRQPATRTRVYRPDGRKRAVRFGVSTEDGGGGVLSIPSPSKTARFSLAHTQKKTQQTIHPLSLSPSSGPKASTSSPSACR
jgi:hypothetical protein